MAMTKKISGGVKIGGGLVVVGLIAGTFLGKLLPGFGNGGAGLSAQKGQVTAPSEAKQQPRPESIPERDEAGAVLHVFIQGRSYRILGQDGEPARADAATLEQIVKLAQETTGDENGIRVRVMRETSARAKTEDDLLQKLIEAGLTKDSIIGLEETTPGIR